MQLDYQFFGNECRIRKCIIAAHLDFLHMIKSMAPLGWFPFRGSGDGVLGIQNIIT